ncbi:MAG TPA: UDP-N-acetylmuramoyl-L-alanine--D-glutamate ligase [Candidatus Dependentiae bacterium]|nr:UDP-N-acetylmuramoyl-L-alanine--D-glutamate ligase [Candidatus Dependentiae bacterium]HRQ62454.1 UDP-N-acetylmuramoyl-L-alanine--D-glutamate ligase [Candidatus Dependentiae bacterium]
MNIQNKKIGIWGFGRVGKSVANFLQIHSNNTIEVMNDTELSPDDKKWLDTHAIVLRSQLDPEDQKTFFTHNDYIIPSPGIDIRPYYHTYKHKWLAEVDLFYTHFHKPIIAITGSVGKTTVTHILEQLLNAYKYKARACGNIGTPMLDIVSEQNQLDYAVIEVSSFQLEYAKLFAPNIGIITNISANHLDRHSMLEYIAAKRNIMARQDKNKKALVPLELVEKLRIQNQPLHVFYSEPLSIEKQKLLEKNDVVFFIQENLLIKKTIDSEVKIIDMAMLPNITFAQNWLIICSILDMIGCKLEDIAQHIDTIRLPEHRMEKVTCTIQDITFINDSKSTTIQSTLAAVHALKDKSIILFIGGLSKGVNRSDLIKQLPSNIKEVYCFGHEHKQLSDACITYGVSSHAFATLSDAFAVCAQQINPGDYVLLSPAGSSYDEFKNYEERGRHFKKLVKELNDVHTKQNKP